VLIDWFTVGAQIVNFLVLMVLLKIFLYDRVIHAMDAREEKIAARLEEARRKGQDAQDAQEAVEAEKQSLADRREELLSKAREEARAKRRELEDQARTEVDRLRKRWRETLADDKERLAREVEESALEHALAVARRVVADMAEEEFQDRLVTTFAARIRGLENSQKKALAESLDEQAPAATVLSAAETTTAQRQKLTRLLHEEIHPDLAVDYRTADDLLGGLELRVPGRKIAWNARQYIDDLQDELLGKIAAPHAGASPQTAEADEKEPSDDRQG
jgi:F-type H+-transporting ATPase subunit b